VTQERTQCPWATRGRGSVRRCGCRGGHQEPLALLPHRNLTLVTGCEVERESPLCIDSPNDKNHRRFDEHIGWFLRSQGGEPVSEAVQRMVWSAILWQALPDGTR
jgi:hypothetical protein